MRTFAGLLRVQEVGLLSVVLVLMVVLSWLGYEHARPGQPNLFLNKENLVEGVVTPMSIYTIMAVGMTCVIITGGIDISVGSVMALAALAGAASMEALPKDAPPGLVLITGIGVPILVGAICGGLNGLFVVMLDMHPFIVTLGSMGIFTAWPSCSPPRQLSQAPAGSFPRRFARG